MLSSSKVLTARVGCPLGKKTDDIFSYINLFPPTVVAMEVMSHVARYLKFIVDLLSKFQCNETAVPPVTRPIAIWRSGRTTSNESAPAPRVVSAEVASTGVTQPTRTNCREKGLPHMTPAISSAESLKGWVRDNNHAREDYSKSV